MKTFTDTILNITSNYVPNETKKMVPCDPPWITKQLKTMLNRKIRLFENYKKHGYIDDDKVRLDTFRNECQLAVVTAKHFYLMNLGNILNGPNTSPKSFHPPSHLFLLQAPFQNLYFHLHICVV